MSHFRLDEKQLASCEIKNDYRISKGRSPKMSGLWRGAAQTEAEARRHLLRRMSNMVVEASALPPIRSRWKRHFGLA